VRETGSLCSVVVWRPTQSQESYLVEMSEVGALLEGGEGGCSAREHPSLFAG
jgi:hypothetical protein